MPLSLRDRADLIGLSHVRLSHLSGRDKHTVGRVLSGSRNVERASECDVRAALEAEERRVLAHLIDLHGTTIMASSPALAAARELAA
jgi:hypothetical protein